MKQRIFVKIRNLMNMGSKFYVETTKDKKAVRQREENIK